MVWLSFRQIFTPAPRHSQDRALVSRKTLSWALLEATPLFALCLAVDVALCFNLACNIITCRTVWHESATVWLRQTPHCAQAVPRSSRGAASRARTDAAGAPGVLEEGGCALGGARGRRRGGAVRRRGGPPAECVARSAALLFGFEMSCHAACSRLSLGMIRICS